MLAQEIVNKKNTTQFNKGQFRIKTGLSNAFDRVKGCFLEWILVNFGFHPTYTNGILQYVSTSSFSILLNDLLAIVLSDC